MKILDLPQTALAASNIILGLMRIDSLSPAEIRRLYLSAREAGVTMLDHAAVYGGWHVCEELFANAVPLSPSEREEVVIQTKAGIRKMEGGRNFYDFSAQHIVESLDGSLAALRTDYVDLLLLHRPDTLMQPEEVAAAFTALHDSGKVKSFGVSNHTPGQIQLLKKFVDQPIAVNQVQLSITAANLIATPLAANIAVLDQAVDRDHGLLDYSRLNDITLQAWSPFQKKFFDGVFVGDRENYPELNDLLDALARKYSVTPNGIAVAWITRHPANLQVVLGTTNIGRMRESAAGSDIALTREEWYSLFAAAGNVAP